MVVVEVASAVVKPTTGSVHQPSWVQRLNDISESELRILAIHNLTPAFVVDHPRYNTRVTPVLSNQELQLALEFLLLLSVGEDSFHRAIVESPGLGGSQRRHILDQHQAELVAGLVK